jgi:hypothetical protein
MEDILTRQPDGGTRGWDRSRFSRKTSPHLQPYRANRAGEHAFGNTRNTAGCGCWASRIQERSNASVWAVYGLALFYFQDWQRALSQTWPPVAKKRSIHSNAILVPARADAMAKRAQATLQALGGCQGDIIIFAF